MSLFELIFVLFLGILSYSLYIAIIIPYKESKTNKLRQVDEYLDKLKNIK